MMLPQNAITDDCSRLQ